MAATSPGAHVLENAARLQCLVSLVASLLPAHEEPVPRGGMSVQERDLVALEIGMRWVAKLARGEQSCAWHEIHEWAVRTRRGVKPCSLCGGDLLDGGDAHELCRARQRSGEATPRIDQERRCPCAGCASPEVRP